MTFVSAWALFSHLNIVYSGELRNLKKNNSVYYVCDIEIFIRGCNFLLFAFNKIQWQWPLCSPLRSNRFFCVVEQLNDLVTEHKRIPLRSLNAVRIVCAWIYHCNTVKYTAKFTWICETNKKKKKKRRIIRQRQFAIPFRILTYFFTFAT